MLFSSIAQGEFIVQYYTLEQGKRKFLTSLKKENLTKSMKVGNLK